MLKKTKIVCTMGPSTEKQEIIENLLNSGMNVARFNFSHGDHEEHGGRIAKVKELSKKQEINSVLLNEYEYPLCQDSCHPHRKY